MLTLLKLPSPLNPLFVLEGSYWTGLKTSLSVLRRAELEVRVPRLARPQKPAQTLPPTQRLPPQTQAHQDFLLPGPTPTEAATRQHEKRGLCESG